ncbi:hypothetical protein ACA910_015063 [Epithemia clementina (nom. ined.)]
MIVNGEPVLDPGLEFPFTVSLVDESGSHQCGGTLVAWDVVLTAAHCFEVVYAARILVSHNINNHNNKNIQHDNTTKTANHNATVTTSTTTPTNGTNQDNNNNNNHHNNETILTDENNNNNIKNEFVTYALRRGGNRVARIRHPRFFPHDIIDETTGREFVDVDPYDIALLALNRPPPPPPSVVAAGLVKASQSAAVPNESRNDNNIKKELLPMATTAAIAGSIIEWNTDATVPAGRQGLTVVGWGITDAYKKPKMASPTLQRTVLFHIPNPECKTINYTSKKGINVAYEKEIIDVSLCAFDWEGQPQTDACSGDSGSPLLIQRPKQQQLNGEGSNNNILFNKEWIQVGVHSSNYGCLHPSLPSLNVRLSVVQEWIHESVCRLTRIKSDSSTTNGTMPSPAPLLPFSCPPPPQHPPLILSTEQSVSLRIQLDDYPTETGFYFQAKIVRDHSYSRSNTATDATDEYQWVTIAEVFPGTFTERNATDQRSLYLLESPVALEYKFVITDNEHDGGPKTYVWFEDDNRGEKEILVVDDGSFFLERPYFFPPPPPVLTTGMTKPLPPTDAPAAIESSSSSTRARHTPRLGIIICLSWFLISVSLWLAT